MRKAYTYESIPEYTQLLRQRCRGGGREMGTKLGLKLALPLAHYNAETPKTPKARSWVRSQLTTPKSHASLGFWACWLGNLRQAQGFPKSGWEKRDSGPLPRELWVLWRQGCHFFFFWPLIKCTFVKKWQPCFQNNVLFLATIEPFKRFRKELFNRESQKSAICEKLELNEASLCSMHAL